MFLQTATNEVDLPAIWYLAFIALTIVSDGFLCWRAMSASNYERRWRAWVPVWNFLVLCDLDGVSRWWAFMPFVNIWILPPVIGFSTAQRIGFTWIRRPYLGLTLVSFIGFPILGLLLRADSEFEFEENSRHYDKPVRRSLLEASLFRQATRFMLILRRANKTEGSRT